MDIAEFLALKDIEKQILFESRPALELASKTWTAIGGPYPNLYVYNNFNWEANEVVEIVVNGTVYTEEFNPVDCNANPATWHYDDYYRNLFIHMVDSDDPTTQFSDLSLKYTIMAYFWEGYTNRQDPDNIAVFEREDPVLLDGGVEIWTSAVLLKYWAEIIGGASTVTRSTDTFDTDSAYSACITLDGVPTAAYIYQNITLKPRRKSVIRIRYKATDAWSLYFSDIATNVYLQSNGQWAAAGSIAMPASAVWTTFELEFVAHASYSAYVIIINPQIANSITYVDNMEVNRIRQPMYYKPYLHWDAIPSIYHAVGDYHVTDERIQYGAIDMINPAEFYTKKNGGWIWHNKQALIKIQQVGSDYYDYEKIFDGVTRTPKFADLQVVFNLKDTRISALGKIPRERFDTTTFPNIDPRFENSVIPLLFGYKLGIVPICEDTANRIYRVSQTVFDGVTYAMQSVVNVYVDDQLLTVAVDYTVDLNNGRFTLLIDPGDGQVTCDAQGVKCDFQTAATYSNLAADIIHFLLVVANGVNEENLDYPSLLDLKANRTQAIGLYLDTETETLDVFSLLKQSVVFHVYTLLSGKYVFKRYAAGTTGNEPRFRTEDYYDFSLEELTDQAFEGLILRYNQDPGTKEWQEVSDEYTSTLYKHGIKNILILETALKSQADAENVRNFYLRLLRDPSDRLYATLPERALLINPAEKGIFDRHILDHEGNEVAVVTDEVYRILELRKDSQRGKTSVVAIKDMQSVGFEFHSDVAHEDTHADAYTDIHSDAGHNDSGHTDTHTDAYTDSYVDTRHIDFYSDSHDDYAYTDAAYTDSHTDVAYLDAHSDEHEDHSDVGYEDTYVDAHWDTPHEDAHTDVPHEDTPHGDGHTDNYYDSHADTYTDSYSDAHGDAAHGDAAHTDSYVDSHTDTLGDVSHGDSYV